MSTAARTPERLAGVGAFAIIATYTGLAVARHNDWVPASWSLMPVVETAWLSFVVVIVAVLWLRARDIPLARVGLGPLPPMAALLPLVAATIVVDMIATGTAMPLLSPLFPETPPVARFEAVPGNLPLLLMLLPFVWLFAAFGEEFFFRGFLMSTIADLLGNSRAAWIAAVLLQAIAFGALHAYQGPVQAISIGIGGAVYGAAFLVAKKSLWPVMIAHGLNDTLGLVLLYSGALTI